MGVVSFHAGVYAFIPCEKDCKLACCDEACAGSVRSASRRLKKGATPRMIYRRGNLSFVYFYLTFISPKVRYFSPVKKSFLYYLSRL